MRILIITARYYPEQFSITAIAEELTRQGHQVTVLTGRPNYGYGHIFEGYENVVNEEVNGVSIIRVKEKARVPGFKGLLQNYLSIHKQFKKGLAHLTGDYDVILSHVISPIFTMAKVGKFAKKHHLTHVHYGLDLWPESLVATGYMKRKSLPFKMMKRYSTNLYAECDAIAFSSPSAEHYIHEYLGLKDIPFKHIYQPCLSQVPSMEELRKHRYLEDGLIHLTYCGSVARFHRLDLLIEALAQASAKERYHLDIIGSGSELEHVQEAVKEKQVEHLVTFHGRVPIDQTRNFYLQSDVLYVPLINNSETSKLIPQKLIEYLMYGKPIIGMIAGDGAELLKQASIHNVLSDQTVEDLAVSLDKVAQHTDKFALWGHENRAYFDQEPRFQLTTVCEELVDLMQATMAQKNKK